jgi:hypothetical protein
VKIQVVTKKGGSKGGTKQARGMIKMKIYGFRMEKQLLKMKLLYPCQINVKTKSL